jgi:N-methylhydantoinase A
MDTISGTDNTSCTFNVPQAKGSRAVWFGAESGFVETPVFNRYELQSMTKIDGPSIIEEVESTLILPPGFTAEVDNARNLIVSYG